MTTMMGACGLACDTCELRTYPANPEAAQTVLSWFRSQGWLAEGEGLCKALSRGMVCTGCHGSRETHWSADCWILQCAVDTHGLADCSACAAFPCERLVTWAGTDESYGRALERLRALRGGGPSAA